MFKILPWHTVWIKVSALTKTLQNLNFAFIWRWCCALGYCPSVYVKVARVDNQSFSFWVYFSGRMQICGSITAGHSGPEETQETHTITLPVHCFWFFAEIVFFVWLFILLIKPDHNHTSVCTVYNPKVNCMLRRGTLTSHSSTLCNFCGESLFGCVIKARSDGTVMWHVNISTIFYVQMYCVWLLLVSKDAARLILIT